MTNGLVLSLLVVKSLATVAAVGRDDRVITALCKAKDKISDIAHEANKLKQATSGTIHKAKEKVKARLGKPFVQKGQDVKERAKESIDKANEAATTTEDTAKTMGDDLVTNTSEQVENVQEKARKKQSKLRTRTATKIAAWGGAEQDIPCLLQGNGL
ncbi:hypothetical protein Goshw_018416 [Gossypium schwendimanii]|uniref:Uncharacterized protein n=1 Tax=Gossypium schwendimanii TaxID=34291 RepID=A0A7J9NCD4_GOSSC|nr:hypothetical protein [Gossypium schwendimanii]